MLVSVAEEQETDNGELTKPLLQNTISNTNNLTVKQAQPLHKEIFALFIQYLNRQRDTTDTNTTTTTSDNNNSNNSNNN